MYVFVDVCVEGRVFSSVLAVYLAETGVSRHSSPFLILTDEFNPSLQPLRGRGERRGEKGRGGEEGW